VVRAGRAWAEARLPRTPPWSPCQWTSARRTSGLGCGTAHLGHGVPPSPERTQARTEWLPLGLVCEPLTSSACCLPVLSLSV